MVILPWSEAEELQPSQVYAPRNPVHPGDVGVDLFAIEDVEVKLFGVTYIPTGVRFEPPPDTWLLLTGRSSTAKAGLATVPGVIDNGYRGEMYAGVYPIDGQVHMVAKGTAVCQAILIPAISPILHYKPELAPAARGANGFGSTGAAHA